MKCLQWYSMATLLGGLAVASANQMDEAQNQEAECKSLTDAESELIKSMTTEYNELGPVQENPIFAIIEDISPAVSRCMASIDVGDIILGLTPNQITECGDTLDTMLNPKQSVVEYGESVLEEECASMESLTTSCPMTFIIEKLQEKAKLSSCCNEMNNMMMSMFGDDILPTAELMIGFMNQIVCSKNTVTSADDVTTSELCGKTLADAVLQVNDAQFGNIGTALVALSAVSETQICKAVNGEIVETSAGDKVQFMSASGTYYGACYKPYRDFMTQIASMPIVQETNVRMNDMTFALTDLFTEGECVNAKTVIDWMEQDDKPIMMLINLMEAIRSQLAYMVTEVYGEDVSNESQWSLLNVDIVSEAKKAMAQMHSMLDDECLHFMNNMECDENEIDIGHTEDSSNDVPTESTPPPVTPSRAPTDAPPSPTSAAPTTAPTAAPTPAPTTGSGSGSAGATATVCTSLVMTLTAFAVMILTL